MVRDVIAAVLVVAVLAVAIVLAGALGLRIGVALSLLHRPRTPVATDRLGPDKPGLVISLAVLEHRSAVAAKMDVLFGCGGIDRLWLRDVPADLAVFRLPIGSRVRFRLED